MQDAAEVERTLRSIERQVLEDVRIGATVRRAAVAAAILVAVSAILGGQFSVQTARGGPHADWLSVVATSFFAFAAASSLYALRRQRFRWCCVALYVAALAEVTGVAAVWSQQTGPAGALSWWAPSGVVAATVLAIGWLAVVVTPLHRSQPDMRAASAGGSVSR